MKKPMWRKKRYFLLLLATIGAMIYAVIVLTYFNKYPESDHYKAGQFFNTPETRPVKDGTMNAMWEMMSHPERYRPASRLPMQTPDWQAFLAPSDHAKFIWFGHSSLLMRVQGKTIFLDPVYAEYASPVSVMMKRFQEPPVALRDLPPIDIVMYTHAHYDHLDKAVVKFFAKNQPNIQFVVPLGVNSYLREWGIRADKITEFDWWQTQKIQGVEFHAVPARHDSARTPFDGKKTLWLGWVIQTPHEKLYFSGDSSYAPHFAAIGDKFGGFDLAFIENGQYNTLWEDNHMFPPQTIQAALDVKTKRMMPIHWGAYPLSTHGWNESVRDSSAIAAEKSLPMLTPIMGQVFDKNTESSDWWRNIQ